MRNGGDALSRTSIRRPAFGSTPDSRRRIRGALESVERMRLTAPDRRGMNHWRDPARGGCADTFGCGGDGRRRRVAAALRSGKRDALEAAPTGPVHAGRDNADDDREKAGPFRPRRRVQGRRPGRARVQRRSGGDPRRSRHGKDHAVARAVRADGHDIRPRVRPAARGVSRGADPRGYTAGGRRARRDRLARHGQRGSRQC